MVNEKSKRDGDVQMLFDIKHIIEKSRTVIHPSEESHISKIYSELDNLNKKFEDLKNLVIIGVKNRRESPKKNRIKKQIIFLLQKHKRLNSQQLGELLKLSRVRANEYLKEMENEKITKGVIIKRKKYYMLEDDLMKSLGSEVSE